MTTAKRSRSLVGLMTVALFVGACGSSATPSPSASSPAATPAPSIPATTDATASAAPTPTAAPAACMTGPKINLNLWIFEGEDTILTKFKAGFEASHPSCTLEVTLIPEDSYVTKLDTAFAAGSPPDVAYVYEQRWQKAGVFLPLDDAVAARGIDLTHLSQGPLGACQITGKLYCIGSYLGAVVLLYDKKAFDAAGLAYPSATVPMSVDEYSDLATKLAKPNSDVAKRVWGGQVAPTYWWMDPTTLVGDDGKTVTGFIDDEATTHAWQVLGTMAKDGTAITSDAVDATGADSADLLATHKLAMAIGDSIDVGNLETQSGVSFGIAPVPVEKEGDPAWVPTWTDQWGVPAKTGHPEEAKELVTWIATEGAKIRLDNGTMPLDLKLAGDAGFASGKPDRQQLLDLVALAKSGEFVPGLFSALSPTIEDSFAAVASGTKAADALKDAAPGLQDDLDQQWQTWNSIQ